MSPIAEPTCAFEVEQGPIYFISDVHLGSPVGPADRESWLLELLREVPARASALLVLGDLFDFWFEYRHAVPKGTFRIARAFADARDAGVPVYYLGGNHDFWVADWLERELGVTVFDHPIHARLHGRIVHLAHGDGLGPGDTGYKILRVILRNPLAIWAYRWIHPDLGIPFAHLASRLSRDSRDDTREVLLPKIVRDVVRPRVGGPVSAMVMGHVHEPTHYRDATGEDSC
ncbi:MAG: UDP-2,3-diacylglucosamine diphosphatase [Candidatus Eisenbacteria bacterium]